MKKNPSHEFDVALSYASEDFHFVDTVAKCLQKNGIRLFYDSNFKTRLWGKNLYTHLNEIYGKKSRFCVMFISSHYKNKLWTNHEREIAQEKAFREHQTYILPYRFDQTEIPGLLSTVAYLDNMSPSLLCKAIIAKVHDQPFKGNIQNDIAYKIDSYKTKLKLPHSRLWIPQFKKALAHNPNDSLLNLIYCIQVLKHKELSSLMVSSALVRELEERLYFPLNDTTLRATALFIQAYIKYDFYESKGNVVPPKSKVVFQQIITLKQLPDDDFLSHLEPNFSRNLINQYKKLKLWLK